MKLKIFDTLEKKKIDLAIEKKREIKIYVCGPTVYDNIHIGNLRPAIVFDVFIRALINAGFKVKYVQNITDIDDKIIEKAKKIKKKEQEITEKYKNSYLKNLFKYNIKFADKYPKVSKNIEEIISFIEDLIEKKEAYIEGGDVYYKINNKEYGKLSGQVLQNLKTTEEKNKNKEKDFVLWKETFEGIKWNSPWSKGRPGWHTECVVLIKKFFENEKIDIHGGGSDLIFPHHENERIQFLASLGKEITKIWIHVGHVFWQGEKMSKSLGNVILARKFEKEYGADVLRYLFLNTPYKKIINFDEKLIKQGLNYLEKIKKLTKKIKLLVYIEKIELKNRDQIFQKKIIKYLTENIRTNKVISELEKIISEINKKIDNKEVNESLEIKINNFYFLLEIMGFSLRKNSYNFEEKLLITNWIKKTEKKEYIESDLIRDKLKERGVI